MIKDADDIENDNEPEEDENEEELE